MKILSLFFIGFFTLSLKAQKIEIPKGVVYKYGDSASLEKAKTLLSKEISDTPSYALDPGILFIGPMLWSRIKSIEPLQSIKGGDITITAIDKKKPSGKLIQSAADFKLIWDHLRKEIKGKSYKLRKATPYELEYYWAVISFDIEEPLIILETAEHNYLFNLSPKNNTLVWLDETPRPK